MTEQAAGKTVVAREYAADLAQLWALWTTKEGFESWWGPEQFQVSVHQMDAKLAGVLHYDMIADTADAVAAMEQMGAPVVQPCRGWFSAFEPQTRLALTQNIDFLPDVAAYEHVICVDFAEIGAGLVCMTMTLGAMHDAATTAMQMDGFLSQLTKLDSRFGWKGPGHAI